MSFGKRLGVLRRLVICGFFISWFHRFTNYISVVVVFGVVAPMVEHSDLAYRMMTRHYGAELVFTQMFNCNSFISSKETREMLFSTTTADRPLIVQFAGHDPETFLAAAKMVSLH
jgi:hypothetical protein